MLKREMNIADYDAELWQAMEQEKVRHEELVIAAVVEEEETRPPTGRCLPRRRASCWPRIKWRWCLAAGRRSRVNRSCRCLRN